MYELISKLKQHNVNISVVGENLELDFPKGFNADDLIEEIRQNKEALIMHIRKISSKRSGYTPILPAAKKDYYALSSVQKRLYFLYKFDSQSLAYNMPQVVRLTGPLDSEKIVSVFRSLISHYEILRTRIQVISEIPVQQVLDHIDFNLEEYTCTEDEAEGILAGFVRPFNLEQGPLLRVCLLKISDSEHILGLDMHHIITDGVSNGILFHSFMSLYRGGSLPALPIQYKDYSEWQQNQENQTALEIQRKFWLDQFKEEVPVIELPSDYSRPVIKGYQGDMVNFSLSKQQTQALKILSQRTGGTLFMTTLSLYYILLGKLTGQQDIVIGTPVAGRDHDDLEHQLGMFVNTLALRTTFQGEDQYIDFLQSIKSLTLDCFSSQLYQYESLLDELKVVRDTGRNPLFDVMFSYQNFEDPELSMEGLIVSPYTHKHSDAKFDMSLTVSEGENQLFLTLGYSTDLFKKESIERFTEYYLKIVDSVTANPEIKIREIQIIPEREADRIINEFNATSVDFSGYKNIVSLLKDRVQRFPESPALIEGDSMISYSDFWDSSIQYSSYLKSHYNIKKGDLIGVLLERDSEMVCSLYGILASGCAYVPMDVKLPASRIETIIKDSGIKMLVTRQGYVKGNIAELCTVIDLDKESENIKNATVKDSEEISENDLAYVIYTSGSTGNPKGVMIEHRSLLNFAQSMDRRYPVEKGERYLLKTTYSFDVSVAELFGWFQRGGSLVILEAQAEKDAAQMIHTIHDQKISHINFVPSMFGIFMDTVKSMGTELISSLKYIFLAGEALPLEMLKRFKSYQLPIRIENLYGPTETTVYSCGYETHNWENLENRVPIGTPLDNMQMYVVNKDHQLQPIGVWGELCIGGLGVARGYLNNEALTNEKFITVDWLNSGRIYKTGDIGRWLPEGNLDIMGRLDHQVKLRGFRIELGDIETRMTEYSRIKSCIVTVKEVAGDPQLVGYYVSDDSIEASLLREHLRKELPEYMIPQYFIYMEKFPVTSSGKISRKDLPDVEIKNQDPHVGPSNDIEEKLVDIWSEILSIANEEISVTKSFFELGGHSLKAMMLINKINKEMQMEISLREVFHQTTIQLMAKIIEGHLWLRDKKDDQTKNTNVKKVTI